MSEDEELAHLKAMGERLTETFKSLRKELEDFKKKRPRLGGSVPLSGQQTLEDVSTVISRLVPPDVRKLYQAEGTPPPTLVIRVEPKLLSWSVE